MQSLLQWRFLQQDLHAADEQKVLRLIINATATVCVVHSTRHTSTEMWWMVEVVEVPLLLMWWRLIRQQKLFLRYSEQFLYQ